MELVGQDGNIFGIMGWASRLLKRARQHEQADEMISRVTVCGSYDEALNIISEYVDTELSGIDARLKKLKRKENLPINDKWNIIHGDALKELGGFSPGSFDAIITDPPYASGGRTQAEKTKSTAKKYSSMDDHAPPACRGCSSTAIPRTASP